MTDSTKTCTRCQTEKPRSLFYRDKRRKDGLYSWCKECFKAHCRSAYDPEKDRARRHRWVEERGGSEKTRARVNAWRAENAERFALLNRENARRRRSTDGPVDYAAVLDRDGMVCHICDDEIPSMDVLHFDHVIPLSRGGAHSYDNIKPSHASCNLRKGSKTLPAA